jgi:cell division septation protein DedD
LKSSIVTSGVRPSCSSARSRSRLSSSQSNLPAKERSQAAPAQGKPQPANSPSAITPAATPTPRDSQARFSLLVATFNAPEDAQPLIKKLEQAGYKDVRTNTPNPNERQPKFSVLVGHYTRDEARDALSSMRATGDAKLKNARVIESPAN